MSENNKTCADCFLFDFCFEYQHLKDAVLKQPQTSKEDFLAMEMHKECKHFREETT